MAWMIAILLRMTRVTVITTMTEMTGVAGMNKDHRHLQW